MCPVRVGAAWSVCHFCCAVSGKHWVNHDKGDFLWFNGVIHNFKQKCLLVWKRIQTYFSGKEGKTLLRGEVIVDSQLLDQSGLAGGGAAASLGINCFICLFCCYLWSQSQTSVGSRHYFLQLIWAKWTLGKYHNWFMTAKDLCLCWEMIHGSPEEKHLTPPANRSQ